MSELTPASQLVKDLAVDALAVEEGIALPEAAAAQKTTEDEDDARNERTFFRGKLLRSIRVFVRDNGPLAAMFAVVFVNLVGFGIVVPLMPFFSESLNADPWKVGLMFSAYSLGQFFAEPFFGRLSDRIGRKPILIVSTALSVVFYIALAFTPGIWTAIVIRFFSGISSSNISTIQGYVSDVSRPDQRATRMTLIGAAFSLGFVIGPFIGGILSHESAAAPYRLPLLGSAALSAIACLGVILYVRESRQRQLTGTQQNLMKTAGEALKSPVLVRVLLATLCYMAAFAGLESTFGLWSQHRFGWGAKEIGNIFLFIGVTAAIMQMVIMRPLVRRYGESRILAAGLFVFGLSFVLQAVNPWGFLITPIVMLGTLGQAVIFSSICAIISMISPPDRTGAMLGLNMSAGAVSRILGPALASFFFGAVGVDAPLYLGAGLTITASLLALQIGRLRKPGAR